MAQVFFFTWRKGIHRALWCSWIYSAASPKQPTLPKLDSLQRRYFHRFHQSTSVGVQPLCGNTLVNFLENRLYSHQDLTNFKSCGACNTICKLFLVLLLLQKGLYECQYWGKYRFSVSILVSILSIDAGIEHQTEVSMPLRYWHYWY